MNGNELQVIYDGIGHELKFWKRFITTEQFKTWIDNCITPELEPFIVNFFQEHTNSDSHVLDVGSGVVSVLNGLVPKNRLTATDPLGHLYECIFDYHKHLINPCLSKPGESLDFENQFDIVHMRNALDHSQDPIAVIERMKAACKPGGYIIIQGFENEAVAENWQGFHQWNIWVEAADRVLCIENSDTLQILDENTRGLKIVQTTSKPIGKNKTWLTWIAQKL